MMRYPPLKPALTVGEGAQAVYVYFSAAERRLAEIERSKTWPCKIGHTKTDFTTRILQQRPATSMARLPLVGLLIRLDDAVHLERWLHNRLRRLPDAIGHEWFDSSPTEVLSLWWNEYAAPGAQPQSCVDDEDYTELVQQAVSRIRHYVANGSASYAGLARRAGLHKNSLYGMEKQDWNPRVRTMHKCLEVINADEPKFTSAA